MNGSATSRTWRLLLDAERGRPLRLGILGFWTAMGLVETSKAYVTLQIRDGSSSWPHALVGNMPWWYAWAIATPLIFLLADRWRLDRPAWALAAPIHFLAAILISLAHAAAVGVLFYYTHTRGGGFAQSAGHQIRLFVDGYLAPNVLTYFAVVGGYYAIDFARRFRERELTAAKLEAGLHEARLAALRMELHPHFLFNALNAVSGLVRRREHDAAVGALARLGDLLRRTLDRRADHEGPLDEELELLREYLEIERLRFHDRLTVHEEVDTDVLEAMVPTLVLQPLVENAVRHGIARTPGPGRITLSARRVGNVLELSVRDTGTGFAEGGPGEEGVGLSNTRARLAQLYDGRASLRVRTTTDGGAEVVLRLPYHTDRVPVAAPAAVPPPEPSPTDRAGHAAH